jgi:glycosyltransferase involved in cell wall biosynthesis
MGDRPLRVFHLIKGLGRGGAETLLADGPQHSRGTRFEYGFGYFLPHKSALVKAIEERCGHVICFDAVNPLAMLARVPRIARHLTEWRADLVHCHLPLASVVGRLAGELAHVPVISTEHNLIERYHPATRMATLSTWDMQRHVIAVSSEVASSVARHTTGRVPVGVVHNGISLERFDRKRLDALSIRNELGIPPHAFVVGAVAVFRIQKRLDLWLEVAERLLRTVPHARFLLVGAGPLSSEVEQRITARGLGQHVLLPGLKEDVRPFLAAMDVFLSSSDFEGLPLALLEAMAMEVIPVATAVGGIPEVIVDGECGYMVRKGDVDGLVRATADVAAMDSNRRAEMARAARHRIEERFSMQRMMQDLEKLYAEIAEHG